jgi:chloramphenicol-sensitive protein RarD
MTTYTKGVLAALFSYILWGILPVYWKLLAALNSYQVLGCRIAFSLVLVGFVLLVIRRDTEWLTRLRDRRHLFLSIASALLVTANWGIYIVAVQSGRTIESALGYYINPLLSVFLGLIIYRERLNIMQWVAFGFAAAGVIFLSILNGRFPWISLGLAFSFGFYGLTKKRITGNALQTLGTETLLAFPIAIYLICGTGGGVGSFAQLTSAVWIPLLFVGLLTMAPLYLFAKGAKALPLSTLGFLQIVNPTLQFLSGVVIFGEAFPLVNLAGFAFIWIAAILYCLSFVIKK